MQRLFGSGGYYTYTTNAGVFYANGNNNSRTNANTNIGFRSAQSHKSEAGTPKGYRTVQGIRIRFPYFQNWGLKRKTVAVIDTGGCNYTGGIRSARPAVGCPRPALLRHFYYGN